MRFELYPAIDIRKGQVVRLRQGSFADETLYDANPANAARRWVQQGTGWLHVVDLDGALLGAPRNLDSVRMIVENAPGVRIQFGGGLRTIEAMESALEAGVSRLIIGTKAQDVGHVADLITRFGAERIVVGIDAKGGFVATEGWVNVSELKAVDLARQMAEVGVRDLIYTDIARDGMMTGPNFAGLEEMGQTGLRVIASGGISSLDDLRRLMEIPGVTGAILGRSIYAGAIDLGEAFVLCR